MHIEWSRDLGGQPHRDAVGAHAVRHRLSHRRGAALRRRVGRHHMADARMRSAAASIEQLPGLTLRGAGYRKISIVGQWAEEGSTP